ncbi:HigA family addiction module antitoxin [Ferrovum sp. PN-J185]|jgi:addiction module HigA family antidote|uniref:HigA family addiction module antitoxin n=1 Tax=Ferrovum sp. PN-J185 TaxID=1356306 RepID=UPI001E5B6D49|nr:HigA family addiction module antitoxin [Ferrovum sp. PN-J185]MCC6068788.1 HigA family addiction module antitoxin [Ferrovum sp. PN-J185]
MTTIKWPHPGEVLLEDFLKPMAISQYRLAHEISVVQRRINGIVKGQRAITADTALRLGIFFGTGAESWMNLQSDYELRQAKLKITKILSSIRTFDQVTA